MQSFILHAVIIAGAYGDGMGRGGGESHSLHKKHGQNYLHLSKIRYTIFFIAVHSKVF